jgi:hypothetical protein
VPVIRRVVGFTKSKNDPIAVRGFRISRCADGTVDVRWKQDPALETEWRGANGWANTSGFYLLKGKPEGLPAYVTKPDPTDAQIKEASKLRNKNMRAALDPQGIGPCGEWNFKAATLGKIPIHAVLEEETPLPEWGPLCEIGAIDGKRGMVRVVSQYWDEKLPETASTLWALPICPNGSHIAATQNEYHYSGDKTLMANRRLPRFRYKGDGAGQCDMDVHPNNNDGGWMEEEEEEEEVRRATDAPAQGPNLS